MMVRRDLEQLNNDLKRLTANLQANSDALSLHSVTDLWHVTENIQELANKAYVLQESVEGWLQAGINAEVEQNG